MKTLEDVSEFHGHICPGLALGYRVAALALSEMGEKAGDEELVAIVENDSCAVDAVQVLTGCTFGKGNLIFRDHGKQSYTFLRRPSGETLRVSVQWDPPQESPEDAEAWRKYSGGDRSEEVLAAVHRRKSAKIDSIMGAPEADLFSISREPVEMPHTARIHSSVKCHGCGEKTMETRARLLEGKTLCLPCFEKALDR
jgi:formylmethanofuran dehydrogenase subunit E